MPADEAQAEAVAPARWRFAVLESWRGLLAVIVVVNHFTAATHFYTYVHNGWVAVDFFFVLSGFVIASVYQGRIGSAGALARFVVRRVGRLYPLHLFMLAVWLAIEFAKVYAVGPPYFQGDTSWPAFWSNLFLLNGFDGNSTTWNYPSWSIGVEFWANILAGLLLLVCGRRFRIGLVLLIAALTALIFSDQWIDYSDREAQMEILFNAVEYSVGFFIGMLTYSLFQLALRWRLSPPPGLDLVALAIAVAVFRFGPGMPPLTKALAFAVVVLIFAFERGLVSRLLKYPAFLTLGTLSYSIYLTHSVYVGVFSDAVYAAGDWLGMAVTTRIGEADVISLGGPWVVDAVSLALVAVVIASSNFTYKYIEDPARLFFNRLSGKG